MATYDPNEIDVPPLPSDPDDQQGEPPLINEHVLFALNMDSVQTVTYVLDEDPAGDNDGVPLSKDGIFFTLRLHIKKKDTFPKVYEAFVQYAEVYDDGQVKYDYPAQIPTTDVKSMIASPTTPDTTKPNKVRFAFTFSKTPSVEDFVVLVRYQNAAGTYVPYTPDGVTLVVRVSF